MTMSYENWISFRYLTAKKERFFSVINIVSVAGIAIGVTALIVVIGVMTGFDRDLRDKIIGTNSHIVIEKGSVLRDYKEVQEKIKDIRGIEGTTPYVQGSLFLENAGHATGVSLRGIDPQSEKTVTKINHYLIEGKMEDLTEEGVILGSELASYFNYQVGDAITFIAPSSGLSGEGWRYDLKVAGIFTSGMYDYDMNLVVIHLAKAQEIFQLSSDEVSGIAVKLKDIYAVKEVKELMYKRLGYSFLIRTWVEANRNFFAALRLEKFAMFIILTLIVLVASFNIASALIVAVTSKIKDIGILKSIGVPKSSIRKIFTVEGLMIGFLGTFWGLIGGVSLSLFLKKYQFIELPQEIYYVDKLPIILQGSDILIIVGCAMMISYLATIYPAAKASNLEPVDALRYE